MYVIVRDDLDGTKLCGGMVIANDLSDAHALLRAYQLEFPFLSETARIMELRPLELKTQLQESLRIMEVPNA